MNPEKGLTRVVVGYNVKLELFIKEYGSVIIYQHLNSHAREFVHPGVKLKGR